jgi:hypothetical protein
MATAKIYGPAIAALVGADVDWLSNTIKVGLYAATYTPNQDTHQFRADLGANEVSGTGYTAGGVTLSGKTSSYNAGTNVHTLSAATATIAGATVTFRYAVIYVATGSAATDILLAYVDFGSDQTATAQNVNLIPPVGGLITFTVAA